LEASGGFIEASYYLVRVGSGLLQALVGFRQLSIALCNLRTESVNLLSKVVCPHVGVRQGCSQAANVLVKDGGVGSSFSLKGCEVGGDGPSGHGGL
jgi:hypothetical protein